MKKLSLGLILSLLFAGCISAQNTDQEIVSSPSGHQWQLVWQDNFNGKGLPNPSVWSYEEGYVRNNETQYYTSNRTENVRQQNGMLIIEGRKDNWNGHPVTSASIHTYGKKSILYGRVEVRAKMPGRRGSWPAIWMLGNNFKEDSYWPNCGEIDIMENVGFDVSKIHANIHTKAYNHVQKTNKGNSIVAEDPDQEFHVYALEWFEDHMDFYLDEQKYFTFTNENAGWEKWPFDKPQYLILNLAIGGSWGGQQGIDESAYPFIYTIDFVRVYSLVK